MAKKILLVDDATGHPTMSVSQLVSTALANSGMLRDTNSNTQINAIVENLATTATAAGTTTLTVTSAPLQQFTGSTTQTLVLPNATTLLNGWQYMVFNRSTGIVTVNANGGGLLQSLAAATQATFTLVSNGTSAGTWDVSYSAAPIVPLSAATASSTMFRDANANTQINNIIENGATTVTAAGTTTLTVGSPFFQQFTGTTTQTVVLPNATTLAQFQSFLITNRSTGIVTVNANGGGLIQTMAPGSQLWVTVTNIGTSAGTWDAAYSTTAGGGAGAATRAGSQTIGSGQSSVSVTFTSAMANTNYAISCVLINTTDTNPQFQPVTVSAFSTTGLTAKWNANTDSANYVLHYIVMANN